MKVLLFGAGYLGKKIMRSKGHHNIESINLSERKISSAQDINNELFTYQPDVVINTIAKTGKPNVDWCESNKGQTLFSNTTIPLMIFDACKAAGVQMVHIGTGCLYRSNSKLYNNNYSTSSNYQKFSESDEANFLQGYYSKTKYYADCLLADHDVLILRPRQMFDGNQNERNLICKLIKYRKLIDTPNSMVYIPDLIVAMFKLIEANYKGVFNVVNAGVTTPYEIMCLYREIVDPEHSFSQLASIAELDKLTRSPRTDCLLNISKLEKAIGESMPNVKSRIISSLNQLSTNIS